MRKLHPDGTVKDYVGHLAPEDWQVHHDHPVEPNLSCDCGSYDFQVCWWDYPYTGGYCQVVCSECGKNLILIDDYA
jgi:hypothetical protein